VLEKELQDKIKIALQNKIDNKLFGQEIVDIKVDELKTKFGITAGSSSGSIDLGILTKENNEFYLYLIELKVKSAVSTGIGQALAYHHAATTDKQIDRILKALDHHPKIDHIVVGVLDVDLFEEKHELIKNLKDNSNIDIRYYKTQFSKVGSKLEITGIEEVTSDHFNSLQMIVDSFDKYRRKNHDYPSTSDRRIGKNLVFLDVKDYINLHIEIIIELTHDNSYIVKIYLYLHNDLNFYKNNEVIPLIVENKDILKKKFSKIINDQEIWSWQNQTQIYVDLSDGGIYYDSISKENMVKQVTERVKEILTKVNLELI